MLIVLSILFLVGVVLAQRLKVFVLAPIILAAIAVMIFYERMRGIEFTTTLLHVVYVSSTLCFGYLVGAVICWWRTSQQTDET